MKLRSGTTLPAKHITLPPILAAELDTRLKEFKTLFSGDIQHAKELMVIVSGAYGTTMRIPIGNKIEEIYHDNELTNGTAPLKRAAGSLAQLVMGKDIFYTENHIEPEYHDLIQTEMRNFDLETPLIGNTEE